MNVNVRDFGAVNDGITLNTKAIQEAIDQCHERGGGTVSVDQGIYVTGTIQLKSHVTLNVNEGATLLGSTGPEDYFDVKYLFQDGCNETTDPQMKGYCLIYATEAEDIEITGGGTINGQGLKFAGKSKRPFLIRIIECDNVRISHIHLRNAGAWCTHLQRSSNIVVADITLVNQHIRNGDGIDIDSCQNVVIRNAHIDTDDDAVCLKSTSFMPCENITIMNCHLRSECAGIKIGSESSGDFRNLVARNNVLKDCGVSAIKITPVDGGHVSDVLFEDNEIIHCTGPIFISNGKRQSVFIEDRPSEATSHIKNLVFRNMTMTTRKFIRGGHLDLGQGVVVNGRPDSIIENVTFENLDIHFYGGVTEGWLKAEEVPILENQYPECYKLEMLPSYGYFIRFAKDVNIIDCTHQLINPDHRDCIVRVPADGSK